MWSEILSILLAILSVTNAQCNDNAISSQQATAITSSSWDLFKKQLQEPGNVVMSPVSLLVLLAMLQLGAGGNTLIQLNNMLYSSPNQSKEGYCQLTKSLQESEGNLTMEFANGMFLQTGFNIYKSMEDLLKVNFLADIEYTDFSQAPAEAAKDINSWASDHTAGLIPEIVSKEQVAGAIFVLINAIYFKDVWETSFKTNETYDEIFYKDGNVEKMVPMMHMTHEFATDIIPNLNARWLALPFKGGRFTMLLIVPDDNDGLDNLVANMDSQDLSTIIDSINQTFAQTVDLTMPKFKIELTMDLVGLLKQLGLTDIFTSSADLSGFSNVSLAVSDVIQKALIQVDEKGAKAAAVTVVTGVRITAVGIEPPPPLVVKVDHPSLAFIVDEMNKVPLFACRISDPIAP